MTHFFILKNEALTHSGWRAVMEEEMLTLEQNNTWV